MGDLIAIGTLGIQYLAIILVINVVSRDALPFNAAAIVFFILVGIGLVLWHQKKFSEPVRGWGRLALYSVVLGCAFFGGDLLIALSNGQANPFRFPGGALGLPLTFLVCPGGTIICLAGLVRGSYIRRRAEASE